MGNLLFHLQFPPPEPALQFLVDSFFESFENLQKLNYAPGSVTYTGTQVVISSGGGANAGGRLARELQYPVYAPSWAKKRTLSMRADIRHDNDPLGVQHLFTGSYDAQNGFGFRMLPDLVRGFSRNATGEATLDLITGLGNSWNNIYKLEAVLTPASRVEFFIDDVSKGSITTKIPTGTASQEKIWCIQLSTHNAVIEWFKFSEIKVTQDI